jgi:hypothetical protein
MVLPFIFLFSIIMDLIFLLTINQKKRFKFF